MNFIRKDNKFEGLNATGAVVFTANVVTIRDVGGERECIGGYCFDPSISKVNQWLILKKFFLENKILLSDKALKDNSIARVFPDTTQYLKEYFNSSFIEYNEKGYSYLFTKEPIIRIAKITRINTQLLKVLVQKTEPDEETIRQMCQYLDIEVDQASVLCSSLQSKNMKSLKMLLKYCTFSEESFNSALKGTVTYQKIDKFKTLILAAPNSSAMSACINLSHYPSHWRPLVELKLGYI